jgi:hypothetical protein
MDVVGVVFESDIIHPEQLGGEEEIHANEQDDNLIGEADEAVDNLVGEAEEAVDILVG